MRSREKIVESINAHSIDLILRKGIMKGAVDSMSEGEKFKSVKAAVLAAAKMMHEEPELLKGALYNYFIIDSIQVILGDISKKEKEQIIKKMMMDDAFCEDFVKSVDKLVGKAYE